MVDWKYADDFKRIYATNSFGIAGEYDYRILFGLANIAMQTVIQDPSTAPTWALSKAQGEYKAEVILSFRAIKELRNALDEGIKAVEERLGEIKVPKKS